MLIRLQNSLKTDPFKYYSEYLAKYKRSLSGSYFGNLISEVFDTHFNTFMMLAFKQYYFQSTVKNFTISLFQKGLKYYNQHNKKKQKVKKKLSLVRIELMTFSKKVASSTLHRRGTAFHPYHLNLQFCRTKRGQNSLTLIRFSHSCSFPGTIAIVKM